MSKDTDISNVSVKIEQISIDKRDEGSSKMDFSRMPLMATRNLVLFPGVTISIALKREAAEKLAEFAYNNKVTIGVVCQKDHEEEHPTIKKGLYSTGVIAEVLKLFELPDGEKTALVHAYEKIQILGKGTAMKGCPSGILNAKVEISHEYEPDPKDKQFPLIIKNIKRKLKKITPAMGDAAMQFLPGLMSDIDDAGFINMLATNLPFDTEAKIQMLKVDDIKERGMLVLKQLSIKEQEVDLTMGIMDKVKAELDDDQRRMFMQKQMEVIHDQLYGETDDISKYEEIAKDLAFSAQARDAFNREMTKLSKLNPQNPDYFVTINYLDTLCGLPWGSYTEPCCDFEEAQSQLDADHCGLEKVKERVLEQMAVIMHNPEGKAPILCLVGPPGVGKTSLGKSIAAALGRKYQRVSFGGLHDEAEIRGHRRTYIGAMPGRVIDAMVKAKTMNPVLVLDEVDKIGADYKGDPAAALLEVLDPEQNCHFHDNFIDIDFDLSRVLFVATANSTATIARPLLDRMEVINISGYLSEEKAEIAKVHLIRRIFNDLNIKKGAFKISDAALNAIIDNYTSESGVRQLDKLLTKIARKYLMAKLSGKKFPKTINPEHLKDLLGVAPFIKEKWEDYDCPGVVTGLAWTEAGGEILLAEASLEPGKGTETLTGNLGQVMKESASIAYQWVKTNSEALGINPELFEKSNLHVHFPEGAIPKDGPSAGITIATAIASAYMGKKVKPRLAMTGEITLRGKVLPVGGIKEKILAAKRAGITDIVLSKDNRKDVEEIPEKYSAGLNFHYVDKALEVIEEALK